jgi:hypothetical protein
MFLKRGIQETGTSTQVSKKGEEGKKVIVQCKGHQCFFGFLGLQGSPFFLKPSQAASVGSSFSYGGGASVNSSSSGATAWSAGGPSVASSSATAAAAAPWPYGNCPG